MRGNWILHQNVQEIHGASICPGCYHHARDQNKYFTVQVYPFFNCLSLSTTPSKTYLFRTFFQNVRAHLPHLQMVIS